jgi:site-specific DNA-methyltransferase (adenine-specific)
MRYKEEKAFSKNIYPDFVEWGVKNSDVTIALTPSRWFSCPRLVDYKRWLVNQEQGLRCIWHTDDHAVFGNGVSVKGGVSFVVLDKSYTGPTYVSFLNGYADLTLNDSRILNTRNPIAESILEKVSSYDLLANILVSKGYFKLRSNDKKLLDTNEPGTTLCYVSKLKGFKSYIPIDYVSDKENYLKWKVLHRCADGKGNDYTTFSHIAKPGEVATESWTHFAFDSELECSNYISYFETNFYRFLMKCGKTTHNLNSTAYRYIPLVSFHETWDDEKLAQKFGLTEEEVAYINEQVV